MKLKHKLLLLALLMVFLLVPFRSVAASGSYDGQVIFGQAFTLKSGETMDGDLVVIGGVVIVEQGAKVNGSVVLVGGTLTIDGEVTNDVVLVGGTASLGAQAYVHGDVSTVGGTMQEAEGARVDGEVFPAVTVPEIKIPISPTTPDQPTAPSFLPKVFEKVSQIIISVAIIFIVTILAILSMLFLQPPVERIAQAVTKQPLAVGSIGLLVFCLLLIAAIPLVIILPIGFLVMTAFVIAWLMGIIAIGLELGQRFAKAVHREWPAILAAGFGTFVIMTLLQALHLALPCIGTMTSAIVGWLAVGGSVVTVFGSRNYPSVATEALPPVPPLPSDKLAG